VAGALIDDPGFGGADAAAGALVGAPGFGRAVAAAGALVGAPELGGADAMLPQAAISIDTTSKINVSILVIAVPLAVLSRRAPWYARRTLLKALHRRIRRNLV
jgi:hypothetical protein